MKNTGKLSKEIVDQVDKHIDEWINAHKPLGKSKYGSDYYATLAVWNKTKGEFYYWLQTTIEKEDLKKDPYKLLESQINWVKEDAELNKIEIELFEVTRENLDKWPEKFRKLIDIYWQPKRHSKILLDAIDKVGLERCSGPAAKLAITEINTDYYKIHEYDGLETIEDIYEDEEIICVKEKD